MARAQFFARNRARGPAWLAKQQKIKISLSWASMVVPKALHTTKVNATPAIQTAPAVIYHKNLKERIYAIN